MRIKRGPRFALWLGLIFLAGCASTQMLSIQTDPSGAQVYLERRGDVVAEIAVKDVYGKADVKSFQEEPEALGTSPIEYEFDLVDQGSAIYSSSGGGSVKRHYKEGTVRIELEGYQVVEKRVRFTGDPIELSITLQPEKDE